MVKSIKVGKFLSKEKGTEYVCLVFDLGYTTQKVFCDRTSLIAIADCKSEDLFNLQVGGSLPVPFEK